MITFENLSNNEKKRFEDSVTLIFKLFSSSKKEEIIDVFYSVITKIKPKESDNSNEQGAIQEENDGHYTVEYVKYNSENPIESLHQSIHELIHILGVPNEKLSYGKDTDGGLEITELDNETGKWNNYGHMLNESCDEILTKMALSMVRGDDVNYTADDVIMSNGVSYTSSYKVTVPIARLLAFAMNNEFEIEYSELMEQGKGIVDAKTTLGSQDGKVSLPVNDLFYGMAIDPIYTESRFNQFSKEGEYKRINKRLDEAFENGNISVDLLKDMMISISDMFNNKMYQYHLKGMISENVYNQCCKQYENLFSSIKEYYEEIYHVEINFNHEDNLKMFESQIRAQEAFLRPHRQRHHE